jgi:hypothetical protein
MEYKMMIDDYLAGTRYNEMVRDTIRVHLLNSGFKEHGEYTLKAIQKEVVNCRRKDGWAK